jgi:hypothetical protein
MKKVITSLIASTLLFVMCSCVYIPYREVITPPVAPIVVVPQPPPVVIYDPYYPVPIFWSWEFGIGWRGHYGPPHRHR